MSDRKQTGPDSAVEGDAELITATRGGESAAFGVLYLRHVDAARRLARSLVRDPSDVDDLVAEAFAKILSTLREGGGPDLAFRAYLLTALRNTFYDRIRRDRRLEITADLTQHDPGVPFVDTAVEGLERSLAARAFARLPERWQMVLWHLEVEEETPAEVAPLLGLTPNGVSALAYRARERLRQAYLQEHIADHAGVDCDWTAERLGSHVRGGLSRRETTRVQEHLDTCPRCHLLYVELGEVNSGLRGLLAPLVLGSAAAGYLLEPGKAAAALAAGTSGAAAAGTSGAAASGTAAGADAVGQGVGQAAGQGAGQAAGQAAGHAAGQVAGIASHPAVAVLHAGRGAARWARHTVTQSGPTGIAAGSAVGAAILAVAIGSAIFAGTRPETLPPPPPATASPLASAPPAGPAAGPAGIPIVPTPGLGSPSVTPSVAPTPTPDTSTSPAAATSPPAVDQSPAVPAEPTAVPPETPGPTPAPSPTAPGPTMSPVRPGGAPTGSGRPLLVVRIDARPVAPLVAGRPGAVQVTVTVGAPALGIPEQTLPLPLLLDTGLLRLDAVLPAGVRLDAGPAGGGWTCADTTCRRGPLGIGGSSTALLPLEIGPGADGALAFTVSGAGILAATVTLGQPIRTTGTRDWSGVLPGRVTAIGNTLLSCPVGLPRCDAARTRAGPSTAADNNDWDMRPYDPADPRATTGRSAAVLPDVGPVRWAALYWSASVATGRTTLPALLRGPGAAAATPVRPAVVRTVPQHSGAYQAFAEVTRYVRAAGPGTWWVSGVEAVAGLGRYAGWSLVVVSEDATAPLRHIAVDGTPRLLRAQTGGILTRDLTGRPATVSLVGWDGDAGLAGDGISVAGLGRYPGGPRCGLANALCSYAAGAAEGAPRWNTFGVDIATYRLDRPVGPVLRLTSGADQWILGAIAVTTDLT